MLLSRRLVLLSRYKARLDAGPEGPIALSILLAALAATPTPTPPADFDESIVTPGPWGFLIVLFIGVVTILLVLDMMRRIRRTRYREELREQLQQEKADEEKDTPGAS